MAKKDQLNDSGPWLARTLQGVCYSSEGKGRIESNFGKFVFNYESALKKVEKNFQMAIEIPFAGEELLELSYGVPLNQQSFFQSELHEIFLQEAKKRNVKVEDAKLALQEFIIGFSRYLDLIAKSNLINCEVSSPGKCLLAKNEGFRLERDELKYWRQFATNHEFKIVHSDWKDGKFQRLSMELLHSESKLFSLYLFPSQCLE